MIRFNFLLLCILSAICALKVVNFHTYPDEGINDQLNKTVMQIKTLNPDIVSMNGINDTYMKSIVKLMGNGWSGFVHCKNEHEAGILTRHTFLGLTESVTAGVNARIRMNDTGLEVSFWSMHFISPYYAPYYETMKGNATTVEKILAYEEKKIQLIIDLLKHPEFVLQIKNSDNVPVIVSGMFNGPSHLDWTEATKSNHYGFVVDWPVTKILTNAAGMTDSFREVHPDPKADPGNTWSIYSTWQGTKTNKDRINFNFYRGSLRPTSSYTYSGNTPVNDDFGKRVDNEWPSEYFALITEFEETPRKFGNKPSFHIGSEYLTGSYHAMDRCPMNIIH